MTRWEHSNDYQPIAWIGRYPVHTPTLLVIVHLLTMVLTTLLFSSGNSSVLPLLVFSSPAATHHFYFWQLLTYAFVNQPSIWFLVEMAMLYSFGRQIEAFIGRRAFCALYASLLLIPPAFLTAIGPWFPFHYAGSRILHFCVFIAFACLYPRAELLFSIQSRWVAIGFLGIYALQTLSGHAWAHLLVLLLSASTAFFFIGRLRYGYEFPAIHRLRSWLSILSSFLSRRERGRILRPMSKDTPPSSRKEDPLKMADALLEKISRDGIGSLSSKERAQLASASAELKRRDR